MAVDDDDAGRMSRRRRGARRRRPLVALAAAAALTAVLAGCSSDGVADPGGGGGGAGATGDRAGSAGSAGSTTAPGPTTTEAPPEPFTGSVDDFYRVPDPLPPGEPGELVRVQEVARADGRVTVRVMYHSLDARDRDRAVTGTISYPEADPPEGGWPVVAWAHGTTGLSSACAPSRAGAVGPAFGVEGVVASTDYLGLGPVGERHPYLSGISEGRSVIDSVRAARRLPEAGAGTRWVAAGHSQGGHAALFAHELGAAHAPELELLGTAAIAPAAALQETFGPDDQVVPKMVGVMALYGLAADHPEIVPEDYVGPEVEAVDHTIDDGCADQVIAAMAGIPADVFYDHHPLETEPARSVLAENDPGQVAVDAPLLVVSGTADTYVVPARVAFLLEQLCDVGQGTEAVEVDGADHQTVVGEAGQVIGAWFSDRLTGEAAPDACGRAIG